MTKKDFFRIIIKLFGLYSLILTIFSFLPNSISSLYSYFSFWSIFWVLIVMSLISLAYFLLILKADLIIEWFKLDKGFDDDQIVLGNLNVNKIVMFGCILIGGFLVIDNIPYAIYYTFDAFRAGISGGDFEKFHWVVSCLKLVVGFLLITNYKFVALKLSENQKLN